MGRIVDVVIPYKPRDAFKAFHARSARWAIMVCHRRAGKTVACINDLLRRAIADGKRDGRYAYIAPQYNQAKDIVWEYLKRFASPIPGVSFNEAELRCDLPNGARIRLYGAENADRLRGLYLDGVVLDEYADMRPSIWGEILRPLLADRLGWVVWIGTPKGRNSFYDLWEGALDKPDWFRLMLRASETSLIADAELADAKTQMTREQYEQEFECSFSAAIMGAYYAREMDEAERDGRLTSVPVERVALVHTAWDLGIGDSTAIWFAQMVGKEWRLVDFYEASGVGLDHYVRALRQRDYNYGTHYLPHDAEAKELGTGKSRIEVLRSLGVTNVQVLKAQRVDDGINAVRMVLPKCWFDAVRCKEGIEALRQYRTEYDEKRRTFKASPLHDWSSHAADAMRYLALGMKEPAKNRPIKYPTATGVV